MRFLSFDIESSIGKSIHESSFRDPGNDIFTQIWSTHPDKVHIAHRKEGFGRLFEPDLAIAINNADVIIGHNLSFDLCYVWNTGIIKDFILQGGKIWDTQLAEYLLTGQQHSFASLAELQLKYLGQVVKPSRISYLYSDKKKDNSKKIPTGADKILAAKDRCPRLWKLYNEYCKSDGATPLLIFKKQMERAKSMGMIPIIELYNDYLLAIINMSCTGIEVDVIKTEKTLQEFNIKHLEYLEQAQEILKKVWTDTRLPIFNINSPDHKSAVLFGGFIKVDERVQDGFFKNGNPRYRKQSVSVPVEGWGISPSLSTPGKKEGLYSTDDGVMKRIALETDSYDIKEYCRLQQQSMMYKKAAKTYLQAFLDRSVNGVLYPNYNNTITPTGRISSSEPNMQNLPSKSETASKVEGCLVAPKDWVCVSADFSQLEKWVQCLVSGDVALQDKLESGACLHCVTLAAVEELDYQWVYQKAKIEQDPVWDKKRTAIKPVGFLMDYGGMARRVAQETGLDEETVNKIFEKDKELYPQKHRFFEETLPEAVKSGATISRECDIPASRKKGKDSSRFVNGVELLPIFDKDGNVSYTDQDVRQVGYWQTNYGKRYHFLDNGRRIKNGIKRGFSMPQFKNYPNQGGGSDIQAATSAELLRCLLLKGDKIKMVMEIHDSKRFYIRKDCLDQILRWLKATIEDVPKIFLRRFGVVIPFKFPIEFEVGDYSFGKMTKYEFNNNGEEIQCKRQ